MMKYLRVIFFFKHINNAVCFRKMGFVVDKVSEDSFYENLLLGLCKVLEKTTCVSNLSLKRVSGIRQMDIRTWEHNNGIILPEDLRAFFSSTNGFLYTYDFSYDYTTSDDGNKLIRKGKIEINPLNDLVRVYGYETKNVEQIHKTGNTFKLHLSRESKVFELSTIDENAKVVLVYINSYSIPNIWMYNSGMSFYYLAEDFTTYFRMSLAHLGIPCWQYVFSKEGLPEWSREMFQLIAPGILPEDRNLIEYPKYTTTQYNKIDPNIFVTQANAKDPTYDNKMQSVKCNKTKEKKNKGSIPKRFVSGRQQKK